VTAASNQPTGPSAGEVTAESSQTQGVVESADHLAFVLNFSSPTLQASMPPQPLAAEATKSVTIDATIGAPGEAARNAAHDAPGVEMADDPLPAPANTVASFPIEAKTFEAAAGEGSVQHDFGFPTESVQLKKAEDAPRSLVGLSQSIQTPAQGSSPDAGGSSQQRQDSPPQTEVLHSESTRQLSKAEIGVEDSRSNVPSAPIAQDARTVIGNAIPQPQVISNDRAQASRSSETPQAPTLPNAPHLPQAPAATQIAIRVDSGGDSGPVELRIRERAGEVQIAVRSTDPGVATALRQDLGDLVRKLDSHTTTIEASRQDLNSSDSAAPPMRHLALSDSFRGQSFWSGDAQQRQRQQHQQQQQDQRQQASRIQSGTDAMDELSSVFTDLTNGVL